MQGGANMEQEERQVVMHRKEILDQESAEIQEKLKVIAETLTEFSFNLSHRPENIVIVEVSPAHTKYHDNKIYFNKNQLKQSFDLDLIDDYIMSLQRKNRDASILSQTFND
jgi:hypothetical protein